ncbi:hypothetical protein D3C84_907060 [compost metagenome]
MAQGQYVDLAGDAVVVVAAFDAQQIAFPAVLVGGANATVAELAVVALDDVGMDIQRGGFHQGVEGVCVAVPFRHEQGVDLAAQVGTVANIGQLAAIE